MGDVKHVVPDIERVSEELVQAASRISAATLHEAYDQYGAFCSDIRPIRPGMKLCGPVITVESRPGDNIMVHKAIYVAKPGDVLLVDTGSYVEGGLWGGIMTEAAKQRKIAGLVTNGSVRDTDEIGQMDFPVKKNVSSRTFERVNQPLICLDCLKNSNS
jgi:4-hydroxy-4-methyl-2-oxoglutarate aldolase